MPTLLNLPLDILNHVVESLGITDLLSLCVSRLVFQRAFRPGNFKWLLKNSEDESDARNDAVRESSYILRCHALSHFFLRYGLDYDYDIFFKHGASFKSIPHGYVVLSTLVRGRPDAPGRKWDFLRVHGASLESVPGGLDPMLKYIMVECGPCGLSEFLFQHGATLRGGPHGMETLVDDLMAQEGRWGTIAFVLRNGGPLGYATEAMRQGLKRLYRSEQLSPRVMCLLRSVPGALDILLEDTMPWNGVDQVVEMLLHEGGSLHEVAWTATTEGNHGLLARALLEEGVDLTMTDEVGRTPLYRAVSLRIVR